MSELSARARALLDQARVQASPSLEALTSVRAQLAPKLVTPHKPLVMPVPFLVTAVVAALGVGVWSSGALERLSFGSRPVQLVCVEDRAPAASPSVNELLDSVEPTRSCRAIARPGPSVEARPPVPGRAARKPAPEHTFEAPVARSDLGLELLEAARLALDEGRPFDALGQVQQHAARYPTSQFIEERLAIEALALCQAGQPIPGRERFEALHAQFPDTTYGPRIERACSGVPDAG